MQMRSGVTWYRYTYLFPRNYIEVFMRELKRCLEEGLDSSGMDDFETGYGDLREDKNGHDEEDEMSQLKISMRLNRGGNVGFKRLALSGVMTGQDRLPWEEVDEQGEETREDQHEDLADFLEKNEAIPALIIM